MSKNSLYHPAILAFWFLPLLTGFILFKPQVRQKHFLPEETQPRVPHIHKMLVAMVLSAVQMDNLHLCVPGACTARRY